MLLLHFPSSTDAEYTNNHRCLALPQYQASSYSNFLVQKIGSWKEAITIEINPVNPTTSSPTKKRGIVIRSTSELDEISKILTNPKMSELTELIDGVNPIDVKSKAKNADNSDIIEI